MAATKTKVKPASAKAPAKTRTAAKPKASTAAAEKPKAPSVVLTVGSFAKFTGYRSALEADEVIFAEGEVLYIVEVDETDDGVLYSAVKAEDTAEYMENGDANVVGGQVAGSEVTELKGGALEKARDTYMPVNAIGDLAEMLAENDNVIEVAESLNQSIQQSYFYLGGALAMVLQRGAYLKENGGEFEGEEAFGEFCQETFSFKASKGRQLARMYQTFSQIEGFDPARLDQIGWSKAAIAERFVTEDTVDEILQLAEDTSQRELAVKLKEKFVKEDGSTSSGKAASRATIKKISMSFSFEEDSADTVKLAIEACMKQSGIENEALALERICTEWAGSFIEAPTAQKRIQTKANKAAKAREAAAKPAAAPKAAAKPRAKPAAKA
jgi:hypothetical protein